ncbi:hypothetical protein LUZ60_006531 [Juncus effusus]|nr:hypothetical protein LUZ60_006531 [Juncus effusus]
MGNCQVAIAPMTEIQHPEGQTERIYWPIRACHIMDTNPGHYVAVVITRYTTDKNTSKNGVKYLKLLCPNDNLLLRNTYRLVTFEEVLREFKSKCRVRLSQLLRKHDKFCTSQGLQIDEAAKIREEKDKIGKLESEQQETLNNSDFTLRNLNRAVTIGNQPCKALKKELEFEILQLIIKTKSCYN